MQFRNILVSLSKKKKKRCTILFLSFPNVKTALQMYLVLMISNSTGKRSFSKLKMIKNRLRTSMTESRLVRLTVNEHGV